MTAPQPTKAKAPVKLDRRFRLGRRVTERERFFADALGGNASLSPVMRQRVAVAAELSVAAEIARDRFLKGEAITADDLVRLSNQAARAERALRIPEEQVNVRGSCADEDDLAAYVRAAGRPAR